MPSITPIRYWELSNARIYESAILQGNKRCIYATLLRTTDDQNRYTYSLIGSLNMPKYVNDSWSGLENVALIRMLVPALNQLYAFTLTVPQILERIIAY